MNEEQRELFRQLIALGDQRYSLTLDEMRYEGWQHHPPYRAILDSIRAELARVDEQKRAIWQQLLALSPPSS